MTAAPIQGAAGNPLCPPEWLALREPADAEARSADLAAAVAAMLPPGPLRVRDLGCGTGSMGRWLAPLLPGTDGGPRRDQHWVLHDRDPLVLEHALASLPPGVTGEAGPGDLTGLGPDALAGTSLVTPSALLDLLTAGEMDALAATCVAAGAPALFTLSVSGRVRLHPAEPLDAELAAAFDAHQRRDEGGRRMLGPDAPAVAAAAFARHGAQVRTADSPWRLGPDRPALVREWLAGWLDAACTAEPALAAHAPGYRGRREAALAAGELRVEVGHVDVLAAPA
ncbi:SAM-dependent methyltransferase [Pseudonocardia sp. ICBG1293]|uniref:SAM-dependent methyltransferase n=1 Tax=Pseudonocardia sp. ICBG1293 TaxID=2844382 RepID=UPI001CCADC17|nr:SAM-dependent methyltransferase [Pseudonocardia sp. ICBG1293]